MGTIIQSRARNAPSGDPQSEFDAATNETILRYSAAILDEDFIGPGHTTIPTNGAPATGYPWVQRIQHTGGTPTVAAIANAAGGVLRLALDATSEKQEASLYANDSLNWDMTKSTTWEARISTHVVPSAAQVEMVFGLRSAWIDGPDNFSFYADFQLLGSGVVNYRSKDGVNTFSNASGIVMTVDTFHNFRIDATDPTNVRYFVDGAELSNHNMSFAATGANAILQPYVSVYKASGTGVGTFDIDSTQLGMNRS
jgi:hypothetical protein